MADAIDRPNFGLTIDLSHCLLLGETSADALRAAAPHLIHAHIGNCVMDHPDSPLYGDFHPRFGHPLGRSDLPEVIDYLSIWTRFDYWERARQRSARRRFSRLSYAHFLTESQPPFSPMASELFSAHGTRCTHEKGDPHECLNRLLPLSHGTTSAIPLGRAPERTSGENWLDKLLPDDPAACGATDL